MTNTNTAAAPVFTPGPWHWDNHMLRPVTFEPDLHFVRTIIDNVDGTWTGSGFAGHEYSEVGERLRAEQAGNERLIACAPEMHAALTAILPFLPLAHAKASMVGNVRHIDAANMIRAALAKVSP